MFENQPKGLFALALANTGERTQASASVITPCLPCLLFS